MEQPSAAAASAARIEGVITKPSPRSVADTVARIREIVDGRAQR
jgi:hypothetical protein